MNLDLVQQAIAAGELPRDTDADLLIDALTGPLYFRCIIGHAPVNEAFASELASVCSRHLNGRLVSERRTHTQRPGTPPPEPRHVQTRRRVTFQCTLVSQRSSPQGSDRSAPLRLWLLCVPLGVPRLVHELNAVAVEVSDIGGVVAGGEVGAICWFAFVGASRFDCSCLGGIDQFIGVADEAEVHPGLAALALT